MLGVQVATHLKGLTKKAKLNESHAKAALAYKARVASLTSERAEPRGQVQRMTEEVVKLKSDLNHTTSAHARAEGREDEAQNSLRATEGELREVRDDLRAAQNDLLEARDGLQSAQYELQMVKDELLTSQGELRESKEELRAIKDNLRDKTVLLDEARREATEAASSAECLTEECRRLRGDLHQQITFVAQRDEVIGRLRDQASTQWASGWPAFQQKAGNAYPGLDSTSTSLATRRLRSLSPQILLENLIPLLRLTPLLLMYNLLCIAICSLFLNEYSFFISSLSSLLVPSALFFMNCINFLATWPNLNVRVG